MAKHDHLPDFQPPSPGTVFMSAWGFNWLRQLADGTTEIIDTIHWKARTYHAMAHHWSVAPVGTVWLCSATNIWWRKTSNSMWGIEMVAHAT